MLGDRIDMNEKKVEEKLQELIQEPDNDNKYQAFVNEYVMLLDQVKINEETVKIAYNAVDFDHGMNFIDTFISLDKKTAPNVWKIIRGSDEFKSNTQNHAVKLISSMAASGLCGDTNTANIIGNILTAIVNLKSSINHEEENIFNTIIKTYIFEMIPKTVILPEWKKIKMTPDTMLSFCSIVEQSLDFIDSDKLSIDPQVTLIIKKWSSEGKRYAEETAVLREKEKNKPPKKSGELTKLAEHFKYLEEALDNSIFEATKLTMQVNSLQKENKSLNEVLIEKENMISDLNSRISNMKSTIERSSQEIEERKKLNDVQVQYREDSKVALLNDIARALRPEYGDFKDSVNAPMNELLGEIYREKLKNIFKILEQKGIRVNDK